jgi:hypothetical protein
MTMPIHVEDDDEYEVGYGKPPEHTKFKPGQSGNPRGRKRSIGPPDWEDPLKAALQKKLPVIVDGKRVKLPTYEVMILATIKRAMTGCLKSMKLLLDSTDGFKSIIEEKKREASDADRAYIEEVRRCAEAWITDDRSKSDKKNAQ